MKGDGFLDSAPRTLGREAQYRLSVSQHVYSFRRISLVEYGFVVQIVFFLGRFRQLAQRFVGENLEERRLPQKRQGVRYGYVFSFL